MCHENVYRCSRVDLANRHRIIHSDRERGPCVTGEFCIRQ